MKRKLMTLLFSLMCVFWLTSNSIAKINNNNGNLATETNISNIAKINKLDGYKLVSKYRKIAQTCEASEDWNCSSALAHVAKAAGQTRDVCLDSGIFSDTCIEWAAWFIDTLNWAEIICLEFPDLSKRVEPQRLVANDARRQRTS